MEFFTEAEFVAKYSEYTEINNSTIMEASEMIFAQVSPMYRDNSWDNSNVLTNNEVGYFGSPVAVVGDTFFSDMVAYNGNYPGFPGYYVVEGNILFGAEVVRPEAMIKLTKTASM